MRINNNLMAMNTHRQLNITNNSSAKSMEKLSSGYRINRAGDDAAGLSISEKMRAQIRGLNQASRNAEDGISLVQTAEGALTETHAMLQRMRELVVQGANGTNTSEDRARIKDELNQLSTEITEITTKTEFNSKKLLNGSLVASDAVFLQVGANSMQSIKFGIGTMNAAALGVEASAIGDVVGASATTAASISALTTTIDTALETVSQERSKLGAIQNRLEHTIKNVDNTSENLQAAESRIRDVDMAKEMMEFTKQNILQQAAQAMLAQANQAPQGVLQLLR
ncbi:flagellin [Clostridiisalibacter paucivorans]|uniref:flagellin N-terminal helical domain-containing protein n=1 Tax=Clostridiisalibacter paucivorans TaxID=408753 RepID=UPI00047C13F9|nr:flagellin [Clostridiisalibacter paucivorans]